ncbi:hypothetical protein BKA62DRAFT_755596 [Auriculariales sp. MPI-PUGE-AT-0066]|nr:hypothetical protein BKA62DRAFT_755596 [Auriculariales sp. MPI-PUGE-AT-0066]
MTSSLELIQSRIARARFSDTIDRAGDAAAMHPLPNSHQRKQARRRPVNGPKCVKKDREGNPVWPEDLHAYFQQAVAAVKHGNVTGPNKERQNETIARLFFNLTGLRRSSQQVASHLQQCRKWYPTTSGKRWDEELSYNPDVEAFQIATSPTPSATSTSTASEGLSPHSPTTSLNVECALLPSPVAFEIPHSPVVEDQKPTICSPQPLMYRAGSNLVTYQPHALGLQLIQSTTCQPVAGFLPLGQQQRQQQRVVNYSTPRMLHATPIHKPASLQTHSITSSGFGGGLGATGSYGGSTIPTMQVDGSPHLYARPEPFLFTNHTVPRYPQCIPSESINWSSH